MSNEKLKNNINELFDDKAKINAFDKIAEKFYYGNFGSTNKSDIETLMFSLYIEQILKKDQENMEGYSDYTLSKALGISQSRVSNLKVRKELQYPYDAFNWKESFRRISNKVVYEEGKIKLFIPDRNLYLELKNAIETSGGYVEAQLTSNLLQVRLPFFLDLLVAIADEQDREKIKRELKKELEKNCNDETLPKYSSFGKALKGETPEVILRLFKSCAPIIGYPVSEIVENIYTCVRGQM